MEAEGEEPDLGPNLEIQKARIPERKPKREAFWKNLDANTESLRSLSLNHPRKGVQRDQKDQNVLRKRNPRNPRNPRKEDLDLEEEGESPRWQTV